ncbi:hypothetical protein F441_06297 [Phytophthora nicotianae CJ01A1]|uniref:Uncharacterized protein n=2 Tax=Phytophthora nicotianae TaxID=4792 RepID=W2GVJ6_PHYNI|nr:hypothetical protein L915_08447 [Phytophthora nicotianae]ETL40446.1 hypothetical protein L916_08371 [Phytophthora nicotianae]ETP19844.1 hypothetical protein F441_06297 [Phytophthora nicotianae CJ01A1]
MSTAGHPKTGGQTDPENRVLNAVVIVMEPARPQQTFFALAHFASTYVLAGILVLVIPVEVPREKRKFSHDGDANVEDGDANGDAGVDLNVGEDDTNVEVDDVNVDEGDADAEVKVNAIVNEGADGDTTTHEGNALNGDGDTTSGVDFIREFAHASRTNAEQERDKRKKRPESQLY